MGLLSPWCQCLSWKGLLYPGLSISWARRKPPRQSYLESFQVILWVGILIRVNTIFHVHCPLFSIDYLWNQNEHYSLQFTSRIAPGNALRVTVLISRNPLPTCYNSDQILNPRIRPGRVSFQFPMNGWLTLKTVAQKQPVIGSHRAPCCHWGSQ